MTPRPWTPFYLVCILILLFMILSRLVWMQLRHYPAEESLTARVSAAYSYPLLVKQCPRAGLEAPFVNFTPAAGRASEPGRRALGLAHPLDALWLSPGLVLQEWLWCRLYRELLPAAAHWQKSLLILTVMAAVWLARFLCSSWLVALLVAATLLSRGALLARLGIASPDAAIGFLFTAWFAAIVHFLRTGSKLSYFLSSAALGLASLYEPLCLAMFLALPLFLTGCYLFFRNRFAVWIATYTTAQELCQAASPPPTTQSGLKTRLVKESIAKFRHFMGEKPQSTEARMSSKLFARGNLFRTIDVPFTFWIYHNSRWLKLSLTNLAMFVGMALLLAEIYAEFWGLPKTLQLMQTLLDDEGLAGFFPRWVLAALAPIDLHYGLCLAMIAICSFFSPPVYGLLSLAECVWVLLLGSTLLTAALPIKAFLQMTALADSLAGPWPSGLDPLVSGAKVFVWTEAIVLTLGIVCFYHLLRAVEARIDADSPRSPMASREKVASHRKPSS